MCFFTDLIRKLIDAGDTVDIACNDNTSKTPECYRSWGCGIYPLSCGRSPFHSGNMKAIHQLKKIVSESKYDVVHCHTPVAGVCARIACRAARRDGTRVFYTAHGFHFYKGAPLKNWLLYYPVEKLCSRWTDALITINREDCALAEKKMRAKRVYYVPGVGVDLAKFEHRTSNRERVREELGIRPDEIMLLSVGELNKNKNHISVIKGLAALGGVNFHYCIAGNGALKDELEQTAARMRIAQQVHFLGFRRDIPDLLSAADIFCLPSFREGLPVALMEAMASGLPCIATNIRGNTDLLQDKQGGYLVNPSDVNGFSACMRELALNEDKRKAFGYRNRQHIEAYSATNVFSLMRAIYSQEGSLHESIAYHQ